MRKPDILYRMIRQSGDATTHGPCIAYLYVVEVNAVDGAHMVDGYQCVKVGTFLLICIASASSAQTDKDGSLSALDVDVGNVDILHRTTIDNLQRYSRRTYPLTEEFLLLVSAWFHVDVADIDVAETTIGLGAELDGIAMAGHLAIRNLDVLAESGRGGLQRDTIVVGIGNHIGDRDFVTTVQVECIVVVIVAVEDLDTINDKTIASQIVLHPATTVLQRNVLDGNVLALDETKQMRAGDAFIVPRKLFEGTPSSVNDAIAVDGDIAHLVGINQLDSSGMGAQGNIVGLDGDIVLQIGTTIKGCPLFQIKVDITFQNDSACLVIACRNDHPSTASLVAGINGLLQGLRAQHGGVALGTITQDVVIGCLHVQR